MNSPTPKKWKYLARDPKAPRYRQLFVKGRRIAARTLYGMYVSQEEPKMTADEIAADYDIPVGAVLEAIAYCESNPPEIQQDWEADELLAQATAQKDSHCKYQPAPKSLPPEAPVHLHAR
jgi:uncharacterized protein (DUF433 family)